MLILATCYSSIQSYFKIYLILTISFYVYFLYRKSWIFWVTDKELPAAGQNKSIVSTFSIFVVYKSAVSTIQKSN